MRVARFSVSCKAFEFLKTFYYFRITMINYQPIALLLTPNGFIKFQSIWLHPFLFHSCCSQSGGRTDPLSQLRRRDVRHHTGVQQRQPDAVWLRQGQAGWALSSRRLEVGRLQCRHQVRAAAGPEVHGCQGDRRDS